MKAEPRKRTSASHRARAHLPRTKAAQTVKLSPQGRVGRHSQSPRPARLVGLEQPQMLPGTLFGLAAIRRRVACRGLNERGGTG